MIEIRRKEIMNYWAWGRKYIGRCYGDYLYSKTGNPLGIFYGENNILDFYKK